MLIRIKNSISSLTVLGLMLLIGVPSVLPAADDHVVAPSELRKAVQQAAKVRQQNSETVHRLFSSPDAAKALGRAGIDSERVAPAVTLLDDETLQRLADRARGLESDFEGGALSNQEITYILIALATAVVILVIVVA